MEKMIKLSDNQIISVMLCQDIAEEKAKGDFDDFIGGFTESKVLHSGEALIKWLQNFGLELKDFVRFNKEDEPNRLIFNRIELDKENGVNFLVDYDLYITLYDENSQEDILKDFKEDV